MFKLSHAFFSATAVLALSMSGASAQDLTPVPEYHVTLPADLPAPRFIVRATTLHANDETGRDWPGSDEIYAEFVFRPPDGSGDAPDFFARTNVFGDFDTGETKSFAANQNCLTSVVRGQVRSDGYARTWDCHARGDAGPLTFSVKLYEQDGVGSDDLIGQRTVNWSRAELQGAHLAVGQKLSEHIRIGGYTLTWEVQRVS